MSEDFYRAFEDKYRGSRELIKSRLSVYLPFVLKLKQLCDVSGIDLGCGRGEWLELMQENGVSTLGVDLDENMLQLAVEADLNVKHADILDTLKGQEDASQMVISAFHVVEHLPLDALQTLIKESLRVLKPGGILILETPNPENLIVGTSTFYFDPTHNRPIPHQLLSFMVEYAGFERVKVMRLQEPKGIERVSHSSLFDVLSGVSPDYAVVAQKMGPDEVKLATSELFDLDYGVSLQTLASNYESSITKKIEQAEVKAQQAEVKAQQAEVKAQQAEVKAQQAEVKAQQAEVKATRLGGLVSFVRHQLHLLREQGLKIRIIALVKRVLYSFLNFVWKRPKLKIMLVSLARFLGVLNFFKSLVIRYFSAKAVILGASKQDQLVDSMKLTSRVREIYGELKIAQKSGIAEDRRCT